MKLLKLFSMYFLLNDSDWFDYIYCTDLILYAVHFVVL